jgi:hypothetical protein
MEGRGRNIPNLWFTLRNLFLDTDGGGAVLLDRFVKFLKLKDGNSVEGLFYCGSLVGNPCKMRVLAGEVSVIPSNRSSQFYES